MLYLHTYCVRYSSVSLCPTLSRNEKFEQHIRKKTHKPNTLRFWAEGGVIPLCGGSFLIRFASSDSSSKWYQSRWFAAWASTIWPCIKNLPDEIFGKRVPFKCIRVWKCFRSRGSVPMWKGLSLVGEIVRYPSMSLSPILSRNEKFEQHIRKKTHKPNALRFWVEGGVIRLYVGSVLIFVRSPVLPLRFSQKKNLPFTIYFVSRIIILYVLLGSRYRLK